MGVGAHADCIDRTRACHSVLKLLVGSGESRSRGLTGPQHFIYEEVAMPIILWLLGVPLTLVLALWLFEVVRF